MSVHVHMCVFMRPCVASLYSCMRVCVCVCVCVLVRLPETHPGSSKSDLLLFLLSSVKKLDRQKSL